MSLTADSLVAFLNGETTTLTKGVICDFGIDGGKPFGRIHNHLISFYRIAWQSGLITREDLVQASCSGPRLTQLLHRLPSLQIVTIKTVYDMMERPHSQAK
jgi:hypothetical protein